MNKQFEEWYTKQRYQVTDDNKEYETSHSFEEFYDLPFPMQWGVYLEFFDSVGIYIEQYNGFSYNIWKDKSNNLGLSTPYYPTRTEAQQEAIKKAFEILEQ